MKEILKSPKIKIIAIALTAMVISSALISGSIAFFTDSKVSTSTYTAGNVYIELSEAAVKNDGINLIEDPTADRIKGGEINGEPVINDYGTLLPGQIIHKDPTIKNIGSHDAWVAAKVIIEDGVGDIFGLYCYNQEYDDIDIERLLSGGLLDEKVNVGIWNGIDGVCYNENYAMIQHSNRAEGKYEFIFLILNPVASGESVELFDTFFVDHMFGNEQMQQFKELKITVQAFAVQKHGFANCMDAMTNAFSEHFIDTVAVH